MHRAPTLLFYLLYLSIKIISLKIFIYYNTIATEDKIKKKKKGAMEKYKERGAQYIVPLQEDKKGICNTPLQGERKHIGTITEK